jgi:DNA-binding transcriptional ArsR family regulator
MKTKLSVLSIAHALASPARLHVLQLVGEGGMSVTDLSASTGLASSTISFHLRELLMLGLVTKRRRGRTVVYRWSPMRLSFHITTAAPATPTAGAPP